MSSKVAAEMEDLRKAYANPSLNERYCIKSETKAIELTAPEAQFAHDVAAA